jgi:phosphatidylserine decarboxylase
LKIRKQLIHPRPKGRGFLREKDKNNPPRTYFLKRLIWCLEKQKLEEEKVFAEGVLSLLYHPRFDKLIKSRLFKRLLSKFYGAYQNTALSSLKIKKFIRNFSINPEEFPTLDQYRSFNDFFMRPFNEQMRPFSQGWNFPAFAEGRYLIFEGVKATDELNIKGQNISLSGLCAQELEKSGKYSILICRLAIQDYHRFHFFDEGTLLEIKRVDGHLHSVGPQSAYRVKDIYLGNTRFISKLSCRHFTTVHMVEVGALCVGSIRQFKKPGEDFVRGEEKGLFQFGGSTVIAILPDNKIKFNKDILDQSRHGIETLVKLGTSLGIGIDEHNN